MGSAITGILTDKNLRSDQAVQDGLILRAKAGKAWAFDAPS
jgi:hypothetical protein